MTVLGHVHRRLTSLAVRPHLPRRTIRLRLTAIYGGLFLICGAMLLAITYVLVSNATAGECPHSGPNEPVCGVESGPHGGPAQGLQTSTGSRSAFASRQADALAASQHANEMHQLLTESGVALAITAVLAVALGWVVAGRVLRPLRTITEAAHNASVTSLHERLALSGPDDELKKLGDTFDELLGRLAGAFDAQRRFVANASHELRTPLTLGRALLQMTLTDPDATLGSFRSTCEEVIAIADHQERLIEALLVLARSERGLDHWELVDLSAVTGEVLAARHRDAQRRGLRVTAVTSPALIEGDARLAERLVANLVDNALRHNTHGGHIEVATGSRADRPFVAVANTGPVVAPGETHRLFEPFQRLGADSAQNADGLGLGLSIVQAIATAHDATLTARAQPGGGLDITVSFPASNARTAPSAAPEGAVSSLPDAAEHAERGKRRGQADRGHDRRRGGAERLRGHEPGVRERRQAGQPSRRAEQRADGLPQEGDGDQAIGDGCAYPGHDRVRQRRGAEEQRGDGKAVRPASSACGSEMVTPPDAAPAQLSRPERSESTAAPQAAISKRPPSQVTRPTGSASSVSSCWPAFSRRAAPVCAQANRLTASMTKKKMKEREPVGVAIEPEPNLASWRSMPWGHRWARRCPRPRRG
jgi:signal transduction histidine kinase